LCFELSSAEIENTFFPFSPFGDCIFFQVSQGGVLPVFCLFDCRGTDVGRVGGAQQRPNASVPIPPSEATPSARGQQQCCARRGSPWSKHRGCQGTPRPPKPRTQIRRAFDRTYRRTTANKRGGVGRASACQYCCEPHSTLAQPRLRWRQHIEGGHRPHRGTDPASLAAETRRRGLRHSRSNIREMRPRR
jgi:hypothetical protein